MRRELTISVSIASAVKVVPAWHPQPFHRAGGGPIYASQTGSAWIPAYAGKGGAMDRFNRSLDGLQFFIACPQFNSEDGHLAGLSGRFRPASRASARISQLDTSIYPNSSLPGLVPGVRRGIRIACDTPAERQANAVAWPNFHRNSTGCKNWVPAFAGTTWVNRSTQLLPEHYPVVFAP